MECEKKFDGIFYSVPNMFQIIIFTTHCQFFINRKFLANVRNLNFVGDGENKLLKMQQKCLRKQFAEKAKFRIFGKTETGAKTKLCFTILC